MFGVTAIIWDIISGIGLAMLASPVVSETTAIFRSTATVTLYLPKSTMATGGSWNEDLAGPTSGKILGVIALGESPPATMVIFMVLKLKRDFIGKVGILPLAKLQSSGTSRQRNE